MENLFKIIFVGIAIVHIIIGVYIIYVTLQLRKYLKEIYFNKWLEITSIWGMTGGTGLRFFNYIFTKQDEDDLYIRKSKRQIRYFYIYILFWLIIIVTFSLVFEVVL